jgi:hypothetical protein
MLALWALASLAVIQFLEHNLHPPIIEPLYMPFLLPKYFVFPALTPVLLFYLLPILLSDHSLLITSSRES